MNIDKSNFHLSKSCFTAIKDLRSNERIVITKPDKGNGVVIMDSKDYVDKMQVILNDRTKFLMLGQLETHNRTQRIESNIRKLINQLLLAK